VPSDIHSIDLSASAGDWTLSVATPAPSLGRFVKELWEVRGQLAPFREAVLPNGQVEIMFNLGPPHTVLEGAGAGLWTDCWYSGLHERAIHIETLEGTHLLAARLHPLGAATLLGHRVAGFVNGITPLASLLGDSAAELRARIRAASTIQERFQTIENHLVAMIEVSRPVPEFVWKATELIESSRGHARIGDLHAQLGVSRKHLAVSFRKYAGLTPKRYALIHRFLWTLGRLRESEVVEWSTLAAEAGYSDQSHLARDFTRAGAASPREYLRRALPGTTALLHD
jgi:AraC-like DNA-binding protein